MSRILGVALFCFTLVATVATPYAADQQRGTLIGRFVYNGDPPKPKTYKASKYYAGSCGKTSVDESLLVDQTNRGIANVVIWLAKREPPEHRRKEATRRSPREIVQQNCRLIPRIQTVMSGQELRISNEDSIEHNLRIDFLTNDRQFLLIDSNSERKVLITQSERLPTLMYSGTHLLMSGYLMVSDHPYVAVSDTNGAFEIPDLPQTQLTFRVWHERLGCIKTVVRENRLNEWPKGHFTVKIAADKVDLGEILIPAGEFQK